MTARDTVVGRYGTTRSRLTLEVAPGADGEVALRETWGGGAHPRCRTVRLTADAVEQLAVALLQARAEAQRRQTRELMQSRAGHYRQATGRRTYLVYSTESP
ncbi:hypothetical protein [Mycobacterium avium]|uniref:hypothetical protein n=1 Tax=Mycobacterium avium TaxID=1764 RepID=UPI001CC6FF1F|nr:hypothetical protein [Mycobacterium avium]MBZ4580991.1 hypothetical protein [Mycobacterium avium subsp. hominissuis]MBZ4608914.1 hypothetical protein [Mycobacterium avium subsp. hominissuis]